MSIQKIIVHCGAGEGVRTLDIRLGRPILYQLSYTRKNCHYFGYELSLNLVEGEGFEPPKAEPPGLQPGPVDRLGNPS